MDIAIPNDNEEQMLAIARTLKIDRIRFLYPTCSIAQQKKAKGWEVGVFSGDPNEIRRSKSQGLFVATPSNEIAALEASPDMAAGMELLEQKDSLHFRKSGLNHVLFALMKKKNIRLGISFSMILHSSERKRAVLLGRVAQNMALANKFGVPIAIHSFARSPYDLRGEKDLACFLRNL